MKTCAKEIQLQDGEQEPVAIVDCEDPSVSETINANEARTGEKLDSEEMRKRKAKEVQEFDEFEVRMEVDKSEIRMKQGKKAWSKWVETQKDPNNPCTSCLVSALEKAVLSRNRGPSVSRDVDGRMATLGLIRVRVPCSVLFWRMQASRIRRLGGTETPFRSTWYRSRTSAGNERSGGC